MYIRSVYYNAYPLNLYCQMQIIKVNCTANAGNAIKWPLKRQRYLHAPRKKYNDDLEKEWQAVKKRYEEKKRVHKTV